MHRRTKAPQKDDLAREQSSVVHKGSRRRTGLTLGDEKRRKTVRGLTDPVRQARTATRPGGNKGCPCRWINVTIESEPNDKVGQLPQKSCVNGVKLYLITMVPIFCLRKQGGSCRHRSVSQLLRPERRDKRCVVPGHWETAGDDQGSWNRRRPSGS